MAYDIGFSEEKTSSKFSLKAWFKILKYAGNKWPLFIVVVLGMLITSFYDSNFLLLMNRGLITSLQNMSLSPVGSLKELMINVNLLGIDLSMSYWTFVGVLAGSVVIRVLAIFVMFFSTNYLCLVIMNNLRKDSFKKIQELSFAYFDRTPSGWLIARLENDTSKIAEVVSWGLISLFWPLFDWVFVLITMFTISWAYALVLLIPLPILFALAIYYNSSVLKKQRLGRTTYASFVRWLADCLSGIKTIKVLSIEKNTIDDAEHISSEYQSRMMQVTKKHAIFAPLLTYIGSFSLLILILVFVFTNNQGAGSSIFVLLTADLILLIQAAGRLSEPIVNISDALVEFMDAQTSVEKIVGLLKEEIQIQDRPDVIEEYGTVFQPKIEAYEAMNGEVEFKDVNFYYIEDKPVLHNVSFTIPQGKTVAIVGETGSGKTTIANLMCRFYEPQSGEILVDNVDYRDRSMGWLRSNIGYVEQDPIIFSNSLRDNICYGALNASDELIFEAIKNVGLEETLNRMPNGLDTILVDKGSELSMGERQLISFARAILRNPKMIILDEATSNIDTETEMIVQKSLKRILKNRTSLIIAHRLSTIVHADKIIVLKDGVIIESGTHKQLLALKGYYHSLFMNQFAESNLDLQLQLASEDQI